MHRLIIHITDNDKFDKLVELDGLQPYAEALHNAMAKGMAEYIVRSQAMKLQIRKPHPIA